MEVWAEIEGFPDYMIGNTGEVWSKRNGRTLAHSKTQQGDRKVVLSVDGERVTRSIRVLMAEAFVEVPLQNQDIHQFDTVVMLDNDQNNLRPENLAWRPHWYAYRYKQQFQSTYPNSYLVRKVRNINTRRVYSSILEAGISEGILFKDILRSVAMDYKIFPYGYRYEFL